jgi:hypothetical protein
MLSRFLLVALAIIATGCASSGRPATPQEVVSDMPRWYRSVPNDPNFLFAVATAESRDMQLAVNKATADARNGIASQVETRMQGMTKRFQEEVGLGADAQLLDQFTTASRQVVSQTLNGSRVKEQDIKTAGGTYRAYVLLELPIGVASQALRDRIKANEQMYTRFRASEAFKELDTEVQRYEEFKQRNP